LRKILSLTFLTDPAPPASQRIIANNSDSRIGTKSAINQYFQKTGTEPDDFQKIK
jgi:hypothetical protein